MLLLIFKILQERVFYYTICKIIYITDKIGDKRTDTRDFNSKKIKLKIILFRPIIPLLKQHYIIQPRNSLNHLTLKNHSIPTAVHSLYLVSLTVKRHEIHFNYNQKERKKKSISTRGKFKSSVRSIPSQRRPWLLMQPKITLLPNSFKPWGLFWAGGNKLGIIVQVHRKWVQ